MKTINKLNVDLQNKSPQAIDPVLLTQALINCPSVTPEDAGAIAVLETTLTKLGFRCQRLSFEGIENLYARFGTESPNFCFAGHTDVVPVGNSSAWRQDPFKGTIEEGVLYGRGAVDMKGAVACFVAAVSRIIQAPFKGSLSFLITGDEEGPALHGTKRVLPWLKEQGERIDACLVGEPTSVHQVGDTIKIGRRGSLNATLTVLGTQGHVAYPDSADNPIPRLIHTLNKILHERWDEGSENFQPTHLEITTIDVGNPATNILPAEAKAQFNIRFNDLHTGESLSKRFHQLCTDHAGRHDLDVKVCGESFLTAKGPLSEIARKASIEVTGKSPDLSTSGGTSDARFIHKVSSVIELGLRSKTAHQVDECVPLKDLETLTNIYFNILTNFFKVQA